MANSPHALLLFATALVLACNGDRDDPVQDSEVPADTGNARCGYLDIALVYVPPGTFQMGSPSVQPGHQEDEPLHQVTLTHGFCISQHEVTQDTYEDYIGYNPSEHDDCGGFCPVDGITWHQAAWFTNKLSDAQGLERCYDCGGSDSDASCTSRGSPYECKGFRLPTEAEWEYAARGGESASYPNGGTLVAGDEDNCDGSLVLDNGSRLDDVAWYCGNGEGTTHQVAQLVHNPLYLYDVVGNVSEWTHDWYQPTFSAEEVDPWGPTNGSWRVLRGGAYALEPIDVRLSGRGAVSPSHANERMGIRFVRTWDFD